MTDVVSRIDIRADDNVSAGAAAATAALNKVADAADNVSITTERAGKSATTFARQLDPVAAAAEALRRRTAEAAAAQASFTAALAAGQGDADSFARALAAAEDKVAAAQTRLKDAQAATTSLGDATKATTASVVASAAAQNQHAVSAGNAAFAQRQFGVQTVQALSGIASGQPILATLIGQGHQIVDVALSTGSGMKGIADAAKGAFAAIGGFTTLLGVGLAGGLVAAGMSAENTSRQWAALSAQLSATRADYAALADAADASSRRVAATTGLSLSDSRTAYKTIAAVPQFQGTQADLEGLVALTQKISMGLGIDVPAAAAKVAEALKNPTAAAKKLGEDGFRGAGFEMQRTTELMQRSGDMAGAQARVLDTYKTTLQNVTKDGLTPFQQALEELGKATTLSSGKGLLQGIGDQFMIGVASMLLQIKDLIDTAKALSQWVDEHNTAGRTLSGAPFTNAATTPDATGRAPLLGPVIPGMSERATGIFQVLPSTGKDMGYDVTKQDQNILAGLTYLNQRLDKFGGTAPALAQYGGYGKDVGAAAGYIAKVQGANVASLPADVASQIQYWGDVLGLPQDRINLGLKMAVVESGGRQYGAPSTTAAAGGSVADFANLDYMTSRSGGQVYGPPTAPTNNAASNFPGLPGVSSALNGPAVGVYAAKADAAADATKYSNALVTLSAAGVTAGKEVDELNHRLMAAQAAYDAANTAVQANIRGTTDTLEPLKAEAGAARDLAAARNEVRLAARQDGTVAAQADLDAKTAAVMEQLHAKYVDKLHDIQNEIAAQAALNVAYDQNARSVIDATNRSKAEVEALAFGARGTQEYRDAVDGLTSAYGKLSAEKAAGAALSRGMDQKNELDQIALQTQLLGASNDVQARELALLKERQQLTKEGGAANVDSAAGQASLARVKQIQDETAALNLQKSTLSELSGYFTNTFDTISTAITQAFATGSIKAVDFGNLVKSVVSSLIAELAKLAILNPLKNFLFGENSPTLDSAAGVIGKLLGGGSSAVASTVSAGGSVAALTGFKDAGNVVDPTTGAVVNQSGGSATIGAAGTLLQGTLGKFIEGGISGGIATLGSYITSGITSLAGNATAATNIALNAAGEGISGVATAAQVAGASVANAAGASSAAATAAASAAGQVAAALPYIGVAVSVVTDLIQGNFRGAALVATGAALGAAIGSVVPVLGTALGAVVGATIGGLADAFLPHHPLHPYQDTAVDIVNGQIVPGKQVSQIETTDGAAQSVTDFNSQLQTFLGKVGVVITNADGNLGHLGDHITGLEQFDSISKLFDRLRFGNDPNDTSNFGVAKGALAGMSFPDVQGLATELSKVAGFADAMTTVGIQLASVGKDLTAIQIKSVDQDGGDLRTALQHDLPGQSFANVDALDAEIDKVNTFVNGTIPGLLHPVEQTTSSIVEQSLKVTAAYQSAIDQSLQYGLDNTAVLQDAENKALAIVRRSGLELIAASDTQIRDRLAIATGGGAQASGVQTLDNFDLQAQQQREALSKQMTDTYGDGVKAWQGYADKMAALEVTLGAERLATVAQVNKQIAAAQQGILDTDDSLWARLGAANGNQKGADLLNFDVKARQERASFSDQLLATYGDAFATSQGYADNMVLLEQTLGAERLAIVRKYADAMATQQRALNTTDAGIAARAATLNHNAPGAAWITTTDKNVNEQAAYRAQLLAFYGDAYATTQEYQDKITALYQVEGAEQVKAVRDAFDAMAAQKRALDTTDAGIAARQATINGDLAGAASITATDKNLNEQVAYRAQLLSVYGDLYDTTQQYQDKMTALVKVEQAEQVKAVQDATKQQAAATVAARNTVAGVVQSLTTYARGLQTSALSPLSAQDQYAMAGSQFRAVSGAAAAGDYKSVQALQGYVDTFLNASRNVNGSGTDYVADFQAAISALANVANTSDDALTASYMASIAQDQTDQLVSALSDLKAEVTALRLEVAQGSAAPARVAA